MILETSRLTLRAFELEDLPRFTQISTNPIVMRQFPPTLKTAEAAETLMKKIVRQQKKKGYSLWAVIDKASKKLIGFCGLLQQTVEGEDLIELGYRLDNAFWNQGIATEAANAVTAYAFKELKLNDIYSLVSPDNHASRRVAEKNDMEIERQVNFHGRMHDLYHRSA